MTSNWLHAYVADAVRRNICTRIRCTTCGAMDLRMGVLDELTQATGRSPRQKWDREVVIEIASALAHVTPIGSERHTLVPAVRCLLFDCWSGMPLLDNDIEAVLTDSWAGDILRDMKKHHAAREVERRTRAEMQDPSNVQKRREERKRLKQEQHEQRLAAKKERDRIWREKHGEAD